MRTAQIFPVFVGNFFLFVDKFKDPPRASERAFEFGDNPRNFVEGLGVLVGVRKEFRQTADGESPPAHVERADKRDERVNQIVDKAGGRVGERRIEGSVHCRLFQARVDFVELFFVFFKIGLFSFGGGYGMIPLINSELLSRGVISEQALIDFIGVAESTPGPFAVNIATFVGSSIGGFLGSVIATVAVVLPAFIIILIVSSLLKNFSKNKYVKGFLSGVEPFVVGLIVSTGISIIVKNIWINYGVFYAVPMVVINNAIVTLSLFALTIVYKKIFKKNMSSILLIIISAIVGIIFM